MSEYHIPVLLEETIRELNIQQGESYIDATAGGGGHARALVDKGGVVLAIDQDQDALEFIQKDQSEHIEQKKLFIAKGNFKDIKQIAESNGFGDVKGVLFDLGVSSFQIDQSGRGFSFLREERLDMRMDQNGDVTAADVVNRYSIELLNDVFLSYGEEVKSDKIAHAIVEYRKNKKIETSKELADIIEKVVPRTGTVHPATRVFQALRIEVNAELKILKKSVWDAYDLLKTNGRIVAISFHSLEDRIVKNVFRDMEIKGMGHVITGKPITPTQDEMRKNRRSRSSKLRVIEKI